MPKRHALLAAPLLLFAASALAQTPELSNVVKQYVIPAAPTVVLTHARVIDGTGAPALLNQNIAIENGKITAMGSASDASAAPRSSTAGGVTIIDLRGATVMPGIVGMHEHLYNIAQPNTDATGAGQPPLLLPQMTFSAPLLYLAAGVTTARTGGSVEPYADLNLRDQINAGNSPARISTSLALTSKASPRPSSKCISSPTRTKRAPSSITGPIVASRPSRPTCSSPAPS